MSRPILILSATADAGSREVARELRRRGAVVRTLSPSSLCVARWAHRIDAGGQARTTIRFASGLELHSHDLGVVLNRITSMTVPMFRNAREKDREYADAELQALVASWLAELGGRVLPPLHHSQCIAPWLPRHQWASASRSAGLQVEPVCREPPVAWRLPAPPAGEPAALRSVTVVDGAAEGPLASTHGARCIRVARELGCPMLEFRFRATARKAQLLEVDPLPHLGEPEVIRRVACLLIEMSYRDVS